MPRESNHWILMPIRSVPEGSAGNDSTRSSWNTFSAHAETKGTMQTVPLLDHTPETIVILGGGPAGISCALWLKNLGHHPVILESGSETGGTPGQIDRPNRWIAGMPEITSLGLAQKLQEQCTVSDLQVLTEAKVLSVSCAESHTSKSHTPPATVQQRPAVRPSSLQPESDPDLLNPWIQKTRRSIPKTSNLIHSATSLEEPAMMEKDRLSSAEQTTHFSQPMIW